MSNNFNKAMPKDLKDLKEYIFESINNSIHTESIKARAARKITSALLSDERIEINWSKTPVKVQNQSGENFLIRHYPPVELSSSDFHKILDKVRDEYDEELVLGTVGNFIVKEEPEITILEMKCLAYMISELYKKVCII